MLFVSGITFEGALLPKRTGTAVESGDESELTHEGFLYHRSDDIRVRRTLFDDEREHIPTCARHS